MKIIRNKAIKKIIDRSIELIENGWIKRSFAKTKEGVACDETNPKACKFCLMGAVCAASYEFKYKEITCKKTISFLHNRVMSRDCSLTAFNDNRKTRKKDVIDFLKKASKSVK